MFNPAYFSGQYFPPVWFAPGDESHLTDEETDTRRGHALRLQKVAEVYLTAPSNRLSAKAGTLLAGAGGKGRASETPVAGISARISPIRAEARAGATKVSCGCAAAALGEGVSLRSRTVRAEASQSIAVLAAGSMAAVKLGKAHVAIGAISLCRPVRVHAAAGVVVTRAIRNPTDAELVAMVRLTRRGRAGIQQSNRRI